MKALFLFCAVLGTRIEQCIREASCHITPKEMQWPEAAGPSSRNLVILRDLMAVHRKLMHPRLHYQLSPMSHILSPRLERIQ